MKCIAATLAFLFAVNTWAGEPSGPASTASTMAVPSNQLVGVPTRKDVTQGIYIETATAAPAWAVLLFAGNDGALHLSTNGPTTLQRNFLVRTASYWVQKGDAAVLVDTPSEYPNGIDDGFRLEMDGFRDINAVIKALRQRFPSAKIALVGTSRETVSVGNVLARVPDLADAFVLASPVSIAQNGKPGVSGLDVDGHKARVLVVSNRHDACPSALFSGALHLAERNHFDFIAVGSVSGGGGRRSDCGAHSPHGFLGIEDQVLEDINSWLAAGASR